MQRLSWLQLKKDRSAWATKECGVPIRVYWDPFYKNWVCMYDGKIFYEFLTGRSFTVGETRRAWQKGRRKDKLEMLRKAMEKEKEMQAKYEADKMEMYRYGAKETYHHALSPVKRRSYVMEGDKFDGGNRS